MSILTKFVIPTGIIIGVVALAGPTPAPVVNANETPPASVIEDTATTLREDAKAYAKTEGLEECKSSDFATFDDLDDTYVTVPSNDLGQVQSRTFSQMDFDTAHAAGVDGKAVTLLVCKEEVA